jgi:hypothetical protein
MELIKGDRNRNEELTQVCVLMSFRPRPPLLLLFLASAAPLLCVICVASSSTHLRARPLPDTVAPLSNTSRGLLLCADASRRLTAFPSAPVHLCPIRLPPQRALRKDESENLIVGKMRDEKGETTDVSIHTYLRSRRSRLPTVLLLDPRRHAACGASHGTGAEERREVADWRGGEEVGIRKRMRHGLGERGDDVWGWEEVWRSERWMRGRYFDHPRKRGDANEQAMCVRSLAPATSGPSSQRLIQRCNGCQTF